MRARVTSVSCVGGALLRLALVLAALWLANAQGVEVVFETEAMTGQAVDRLITVTPRNEPWVKTNKWVHGGPITLTPASGTARTNLAIGQYSVTWAGLAKGAIINVYETNDVLYAAAAAVRAPATDNPAQYLTAAETAALVAAATNGIADTGGLGFTPLTPIASTNVSRAEANRVGGDSTNHVGAAIASLTQQIATKQHGTANLTNWSAIAPSAKQDALPYPPQPASANLTNWSGLATTAKQDALGFSPQPAAANLTNWGLLQTNVLRERRVVVVDGDSLSSDDQWFQHFTNMLWYRSGEVVRQTNFAVASDAIGWGHPDSIPANASKAVTSIVIADGTATVTVPEDLTAFYPKRVTLYSPTKGHIGYVWTHLGSYSAPNFTFTFTTSLTNQTISDARLYTGTVAKYGFMRPLKPAAGEVGYFIIYMGLNDGGRVQNVGDNSGLPEWVTAYSNVLQCAKSDGYRTVCVTLHDQGRFYTNWTVRSAYYAQNTAIRNMRNEVTGQPLVDILFDWGQVLHNPRDTTLLSTNDTLHITPAGGRFFAAELDKAMRGNQIRSAAQTIHNELAEHRVYKGQSDPENFIPALEGSLVVRKSDGTHAQMFIKTGGTNNIGWARFWHDSNAWTYLPGTNMSFSTNGRAITINGAAASAPAGEGSTLTNGLTAYYAFNESSGNRLPTVGTLTITNGAAKVVPSTNGILTTAAFFTNNASLALASVPGSDTSLDATNRNFTISAWFYQSSSGYRCIVSKADPTHCEYRLLTLDPNGIQFYVWAGAGKSVDVTAPLALNTWHLAVAWVDTNAMRMYLQIDNGVTNSTALTSTIDHDGNEIWFGSQIGVWPWDGAVDDFGKWDRILTEEEKATLWDNGQGKAHPWVTTPPTVSYQPASVNLSNWSAIATSAKQDALGFTPQPASENLTNWAGVTTNSVLRNGDVNISGSLQVGTTLQVQDEISTPMLILGGVSRTNWPDGGGMPSGDGNSAVLVSTPWGNTEWIGGGYGVRIHESFAVLTGVSSTPNGGVFVSGTGGSIGVATHKMGVLMQFTNAAVSYCGLRYSGNSSNPSYGLWTTDLQYFGACVGLRFNPVTSTNEIKVGLLERATTAAQGYGAYWLANREWSDNWIAVLAKASSSSYFTSAAPIVATTAQPAAYSSNYVHYSVQLTPDAAVFATNNVPVFAVTNDVNHPGMAIGLMPAVFGNGLTTSAVGTNTVYVNYVDILSK